MTTGSVRLVSRKGVRVIDPKPCANCGQRRHVWRYEKSNQGPVFICDACKGDVFDRSFGKIDAMDIADRSGIFEGDRRRH